MGIDFSKAVPALPVQEAATAPMTPEVIEEPVKYDIVADREQMNALVGSPEVDALASKIEVNNLESIVTFGAEAAEEISKASDVVLNSMNMTQLDASSGMLADLAKIMSQFDINEIKEEDPGFFKKLFNNARKELDKILAKYHTMGEDVDLDQIVQPLLGLAGEQGCREIEAYIQQRTQDMETTGDQSIQFEITSLNQALMMLEQRTQDLRTAESVAMQSIPMIKMMEFTNMNLVRKINSAFIVTLPVFKQALAQAIMLKRQKIQAESMAALDEKTNEMLLKNAQNSVEIGKHAAMLTEGSSIKVETLEKSWQTIMSGIDETRSIQQNAHNQRIEDQKRLQAIKDDFNKHYHMPKPQN